MIVLLESNFGLPQPAIISLTQYTLVYIEQGQGVLEVDFKNYSLGMDSAVFLSPGQYLRKVSGDLELSFYGFSENPLNLVSDARYLFKHLVSVGYVPGNASLNEVRNAVDRPLSDKERVLVQGAIASWLQLNPFKTSGREVTVLFDLKDFIDGHYQDWPGLREVASGLNQHDAYLRKLTKKRLNSTVNRLLSEKVLTESKRLLAFTDLSTKEVAYELGFNYPTYFNRFFKQHASQNPQSFRDHFQVNPIDTFQEDFTALLDAHFHEYRFLSAYADLMFMSAKTLSSKIKKSFGVGFNDLLNQRLIARSKSLLHAGENVTETAYSLGFKEPNHFSAFFKKHTGQTPSVFN